MSQILTNESEWLYQNDFNNTVRYVLGTKGKNPLVCIGVNPSTAEPDNLDNTLKSVKRIADYNNFDSWIMLNLYPQRATNPNELHLELDEDIHMNNLESISDLASQYENLTIWASWGTLIEKRDYLVDCLIDIQLRLINEDCNWITFGKRSKYGHPHHPLYLATRSESKEFNVSEYLGHFGVVT